MAQSLSEENYLKAIFNIGKEGIDKVSAKAISDKLGNNPASIVDMLKKLSDKKLIVYDKKNGARLTKQGFEAASLVVRKHRLWEVFLHDKLGYTWDQVHEMAEQLEHIHYPDLADRLDKFLGFPEYDPHGDPIPRSNGQLPLVHKKTLAEAEIGKFYHVVAVKDSSVQFLRYSEHLGIGIGSKIKVIEKIEYDSSLVLSVNGKRETVSEKFADSILVR